MSTRTVVVWEGVLGEGPIAEIGSASRNPAYKRNDDNHGSKKMVTLKGHKGKDRQDGRSWGAWIEIMPSPLPQVGRIPGQKKA